MTAPARKICLNPDCNESNSTTWRKGWRLRNCDFANLCHRCGSIYEEGKFCETFHICASGWRCCETCGKRVHCGCIVSIHTFVVLDAGGIECSVCTRKNVVLTPSPMWPPRPLPGWATEAPKRNWNQIAGYASPESWQHPVNIFNKSAAYSDLRSRTSTEVNMSTGVDRFVCSDRLHTIPWNQSWNLSFGDGSLKHNGSKTLEYAKGVFNHKDEPQSSLTNSVRQSIPDGQCTLHSELISSSPLATQTDKQKRVTGVHSQSHTSQDTLCKPLGVNFYNGIDSSIQSQACKDKPVDQWAQKESLPHYWPKMSYEGLRETSGGSTSVITPLFEKMLSASDTSRIGRLVLPKKCAESYFPPISQQEGLPLKVQDITGKEWIFQFRFWPNNNSRMYVLEGISKCIQSLQLQAGDVVSFGRIEPEGKLIIGFRKASTGLQSDQVTQAVQSGNQILTVGGFGDQKPSLHEDLANWHLKGVIVKEAVGARSSDLSKRKNGLLSSKRKRSKAKNAEVLELEVTLEEAQRLFRPPANHASRVVPIEDFDFEEYEEAPVIGRPTVNVKDSVGENIQWAQCDDCLKWRRLPFDFLLPARWTCSENMWDLDRASCDAAQQLTPKQVKDLLATNNCAASRKRQVASEVLARFGIKKSEAGPASGQPTTKHPRHRPGCSCVVCTQSPSGKGPKHEQNCVCDVCVMFRRHSQTMVCHERNQSRKKNVTEKRRAQNSVQSPGKADSRAKLLESTGTGWVNPEKKKVMCTPSQIDLNILTEWVEEASAGCDSAAVTGMTKNAAQRAVCNSGGEMIPNGNQNESCSSRLGCGKQNSVGHEDSHDTCTAQYPAVPVVDRFGAMIVELAAMSVSG